MLILCLLLFFFFFKQKTAYEMRISDWSSDVCSSDLLALRPDHPEARHMAAVLAGEAPAKANAAYIAGLFDAFADSFDGKLVDWLDYRGPQQVAELAADALGGQPAARAKIGRAHV